MPRAAGSPERSALFATRWVHLFEQDTAAGRGYAPEDSRSRCRAGRASACELEAGRIGDGVRPRSRRPAGAAAGALDAKRAATVVDRDARRRPALRIVERSPDAARRQRNAAKVMASLHAQPEPAGRSRTRNPTRVRGQRPRRAAGAGAALSARLAARPLVRPLRIYTLDPSVSDRMGGVATVNVPYEKLERGPVGSLFRIISDGAPGSRCAPRRSTSTIRTCCCRADCRRRRPTACFTCRWSTPSAA